MERYLIPAFEELFVQDGLVVMAPGIGIKQLFMKFVKAYCLDMPRDCSVVADDPPEAQSRLVFCLNATGLEDTIRSALLSDGVPYGKLPISINNKVSQVARSAMYAQGGCYFTTARVMIVDLLTERVDAKSICGILVIDADKVGEMTMEAFILKLFKKTNPHGFVKGFCDSPDSFGTLQQLERCLRTLQVGRLYLYPRFHGEVTRSLATNQPEVIEMSLDVSEPMRKVQDAILAALEACLSELKRALPHHDASVFSLQNGIFSSFDRTLRLLLDPEYHRLSFRTKQLVNDSATIRRLLDCLTRYDAVTFYSQLLTLRDSDAKPGGGGSGYPALWLMTVAAERIFQHSRDRVFTEAPVPVCVPTEAGADNSQNLTQRLKLRNKLNLVLEVPPKWELLKDILSDIRSSYLSPADYEIDTGIDISKAGFRPDQGRVIIIVKDEYTSRQISDFVASLEYDYDYDTYGPAANTKFTDSEGIAFQPTMVEKVKLFLATKCDRIRRLLKGGSGGITALSVESQMLLCLEEELSSATEGDKINAAGVIEEYFGDNQTCTVSNAADVGPTKKKQRRETSSKEDPRFIGMRCMDVDAKAVSVVELRTSSLKSHLHIMILTHDQVQHRLNCFSELLPSHVVVLDANLTAIRQLEVYSADTGNDVKVFFAMYDKSVEEQRYEASIAREKRSFESLIANKAHMVILKDIPTEEGQFTMSQKERDLFMNPYALAPIDSRVGVSNSGSNAKGVIVDVREFRSALPFTLFNAGLKVIPVTLQVGDYILSPEICVERKGISDLFQSFNSGRLYAQAEAMLKHYKNACLLVEFTQDKAFSLQAPSDITTDIQLNSITSKMSLLIMAFPALKILWSRSPVATTSIFKELKRNFEDVDLARALAAGTATDAAAGEEDGAPDSLVTSSSSGMSADDAIRGAISMLKKMPGIDENNVRRVMGAIYCVADLAEMTQEQLTPLIGPVNSKKLFNFIRATF